MAEIRYNPFKKEWVMVASHRQNRPQMPKDWCPFCPGSGRVPDDYQVLEYDNDFPALSQQPPEPDDVANAFFQTAPAYGKCEVILYSSRHTATLPELTVTHVKKLVDLWVERCEKMATDKGIKYVFVFENRGREVGVTMPHPHGQIYGYPFVPQKMRQEIDTAREHYELTGESLFARWLEEERKDGRRIVFEDENFVLLLPFFAETVYGVRIVPKGQRQYIWEFSEGERLSLARLLRDTVGMLDSLFDQPMPYMMAMHQSPVNGEDTTDFYRFQIEFIPVLRAPDKQQFFASSESGAGAYCNPTAPEAKAIELREAYERFQQKLNVKDKNL